MLGKIETYLVDKNNVYESLSYLASIIAEIVLTVTGIMG